MIAHIKVNASATVAGDRCLRRCGWLHEYFDPTSRTLVPRDSDVSVRSHIRIYRVCGVVAQSTNIESGAIPHQDV
jgi:hypothetical protein